MSKPTYQSLEQLVETLQAEISDIKQVQFPSKLSKVAEGWRAKVQILESQVKVLREDLLTCKHATYYDNDIGETVGQQWFDLNKVNAALEATSVIGQPLPPKYASSS